MAAKDIAAAKRLAVEDVLERGLTHAQAAALRGISVNAVTVAVEHELAVILRKGPRRMKRRDLRKADLQRLHEKGVSPRTVYAYGCRCDVCLDARGVAPDDERRPNGRGAGCGLEARMERLMEVARQPIRNYPIHGVGDVTIDLPSRCGGESDGREVGTESDVEIVEGCTARSCAARRRSGDEEAVRPCRLCGSVPRRLYGAVAYAGEDGRQGVVVCDCGAEVRVKADCRRLGEEGTAATAYLKRAAIRAWNAYMSVDDDGGKGGGR